MEIVSSAIKLVPDGKIRSVVGGTGPKPFLVSYTNNPKMYRQLFHLDKHHQTMLL